MGSDSDRRLEGILSGYTDEEPEVLEYKVNIIDEQKVHQSAAIYYQVRK